MAEEPRTGIRLGEVAEHTLPCGEEKSIWMVIHDKVYDVTKFLHEVRGSSRRHGSNDVFSSIPEEWKC